MTLEPILTYNVANDFLHLILLTLLDPLYYVLSFLAQMHGCQ